MDRPTLTVADVFRRYGEAVRGGLSTAQRRVMTAITSCRTAALGGHVEPCDHCGHTRVWYNSCRNRHGPSCQSLARAAWIEARTADLLDTEYFHVVFTVPQAIAEIAAQNKAVVYGILFRATADTLRTIAADPRHLGAAIGFVAVLHTWGQTLMHHPHLHCVVPGGGLSPDGTRWIACRPGFFLPVRVLSRLFRRRFLTALQEAFDDGQLHVAGSLHVLADPSGFAAHLAPTRHTDWVVYAKRPFAGPPQVLEYVGRYRHRVAIANQRLLDMDDGHVRFRYKNYRADPARTPQTMTLDRGVGIHPAVSPPRVAERLPPHPLLRLARPSPAHGDPRPMSATPRHGRGAVDRQRQPAPLGLSRPLRVPHRRVVTTLSRLCGRAHERDAVVDARVRVPGGASRYVMTGTRGARTEWIVARAWREGTRVSPALVTRPQDRACGRRLSRIAPRNRRRRSHQPPGRQPRSGIPRLPRHPPRFNPHSAASG